MLLCSDAVNEKLLQECLTWMEGLLDKPAGRQALDQFFDSTKHDLLQILLSVASSRTSKSAMYSTKVLQFFNKLFSAGLSLLIYLFYILSLVVIWIIWFF